MKGTIRLIYIGEKFYSQSSTMMSSIYSTSGERYDWGYVQRALSQGLSISIRPATYKEQQVYEEKLLELGKYLKEMAKENE